MGWLRDPGIDYWIDGDPDQLFLWASSGMIDGARSKRSALVMNSDSEEDIKGEVSEMERSAQV